jgi:hypothetical protein
VVRPDYYKILGVSPTAGAGAIRSAHRALVKQYHPDLFSRDADKATATNKLQQINEAYAVLGNAKRRREYDEDRMRGAATAKRAPHKPRPFTGKSSRASPRRSQGRKKSAPPTKHVVWPKWAACIVGIVVLAWAGYAANQKSQMASAWMLVENTVEESIDSGSGVKVPAPKWNSLARYSSRSQCVVGIKSMVKKDELEGSKAVFDEQGGTVAITVYIKDMTKRVKNYDCREVRIIEPDSWWRRLLRRFV